SLERTVALKRTGTLERAVGLKRAAALQRARALRTAAVLRVGTVQRTAALKRPTVLAASILLVTILILARDALRKGRRGADQRYCCGKTLRRKCNFIHRAHLVRPGISRSAPFYMLIGCLAPAGNNLRRTPYMHSTYRNFSNFPRCRPLQTC